MNPVLKRETQLRDEILNGLRGIVYRCLPCSERKHEIPGIRVQTWEQGRMVEMLVIVGRPIPMDPEPEPDPE